MAGRRSRRLSFESAVGDERWDLPVLTRDQVLALPGSVELVYAARALGLTKGIAYKQAKGGALEYGDERLPVQRIGRCWRVKQTQLLALLGIDSADAPTAKV